MTESPRKNFQVSSSRFWFTMKRLSLGIVLIALTSSILLVSDWNRRKPSVSRIPHVAVMQHASQAVLDEGVQGMIDGLAEGGFVDGENIVIKRYNAENDVPTSNAIAKEITGGQFDLVLTASTLSLQAVAAANEAGKTIQVFGLVSDPFGAVIENSMIVAEAYMREHGMRSAFLVSDPWHNLRVKRMASDLGIVAYASATWHSAARSEDTRFEGYLRETFAYLYYRVFER